MKNTIILKSLSIGGYRSFGSIQRLPAFSKVNLFIGQNNCGKSNLLRFIHEIYPKFLERQPTSLSQLDRHFPSRKPIVFGSCLRLTKNGQPDNTHINNYLAPMFNDNQKDCIDNLLNVFTKKAELDNTSEVWFEYDENKTLISDVWLKSYEILTDISLEKIWNHLARMTGGGRDANWIPDVIKKLQFQDIPSSVEMIPAIRQIGAKGSTSEDFSGQGIIEKLVILQNPDVHNQESKKKFESINEFLRSVTDNKTAQIEIPHERDTVLVHMDGKTLPLESLGTGIHEVIILAAAATVLENTVICMEEPELHLNPILQKKLVRYLQNSTNNQYFISTHSAALMDTPNAETYQVSLINNESIVERVTSDKHRSAICEDLGYHPSDLLQSNCVIWVEGPSDRVYLNYWLKHLDKSFIEGIHYSIMFYGGRLASHLSGEDEEALVKDFISLRRLNRRGVIVIDSDKSKASDRINKTKQRLKDEFNKGPGYAWITKGREIENYLASNYIEQAIKKLAPSAKINSTFGQFENTLFITPKTGKKTQASKVAVANYVIENFEADLSVLDLNKEMKALVKFIKESNPSIEVN